MRSGALAAAGALAATIVAVGAAGAAAPPGAPPHGKVLLGVVTPNPDAFDRLTGKHHVLRVVFGAFRGDVTTFLAREHARGRIPVLSLSSQLSAADIARGAEDAWLTSLARQVHGSGVDVWLRPFPEMNGYWNPWCGFEANGSPRGASRSPAAFVKAFRRVALILRGGPAAAVNRRLAALGQPPMRGGGDVAPSGKVAIVWNPQGHGTPFIPANGPKAYWPGPAYVDYVGNDLYSDSGEPSWTGMDTLYAFGKPYLVAEWALEREDDPAWAERIFAWVAAHPRTIGLVYFDKGWSGGSGAYALGPKPRSLAVYRHRIKQARFLATMP
jgi:hypothetical protein